MLCVVCVYLLPILTTLQLQFVSSQASASLRLRVGTEEKQ